MALSVVLTAGFGASSQLQAAEVRDLVIEAEGRAIRMQVVLTVDGRSVADLRQSLVDTVVQQADKNGDGQIDRAEAMTAFQMLGKSPDGYQDSHAGSAQLFAELLSSQLGAPFEIVVQPQPLVDRLELLTALDKDRDGSISAAELGDAVSLLDRYDADGDGLLSQPELAPTEPLQPTPLRSGENFPAGRFPFRWEAASEDPHFIVEVKLIGRAFGRPKIIVADAKSSSPLEESLAPTITSEPRKTSVDMAGLIIDLEATPARITTEDVKRFYLLQFRQRDEDKNGYLDESEFLGLGLPGLDFRNADSNGDGMLFPDELRAQLDALILRETSRVRIDVSFERQSLFSQLDSDGDERLSRRELLNAEQVLTTIDLDGDGRIGIGEFGGRYRLAFKVPNLLEGANPRMLADFQAMSRNPSPRALEGPAWFAAMDRNSDGDVSQREFMGSLSLFTALDTDEDGLISPDEAKSAEETVSKRER